VLASDLKKDDLIDAPNIVKVLKIKHSIGSSGKKSQHTLEHVDLFEYQKNNKIRDTFCKKDKETNIQMKFTCLPCRTFLESVLALKSHIIGGKHLTNLSLPYDPEELSLAEGKCRFKGKKRFLDEVDGDRLSKRERTRKNKEERSIPILPQHTEAKFEETETYFENGLRRVRPYYFEFTTHAKGRWLGMKISDVFAKEFRSMTPEEYNRNLELGLVKVNGKKIGLDYELCNNDFLTHKVHRHELPVVGQQIKIVHEDQDWVVVDKPASMPVHPCGRYRHNTVLFILGKEHGLKNLHTIHRLDRLTSGVLMFGKTAAKSRDMELLIRNREVEKEYVCRVTGEFPEGPITCDEPIEIVSYKIGVCVVSKAGKECSTHFQRLSYRDGMSTVSCRPKSGRMHQIRVHLQFLGHPITNDPLYNSEIFGPEKGKGGNIGKTKEKLIEDLIEFHTVENWVNSDAFEASEAFDAANQNDSAALNTKKKLLESAALKSVIIDDERKDNTEESDNKPISENIEKHTEDTSSSVMNQMGTKDPHCQECQTEYKDPLASTLVMYLHALKYSGPGWSFKTDLPTWAKVD